MNAAAEQDFPVYLGDAFEGLVGLYGEAWNRMVCHGVPMDLLETVAERFQERYHLTPGQLQAQGALPPSSLLSLLIDDRFVPRPEAEAAVELTRRVREWRFEISSSPRTSG